MDRITRWAFISFLWMTAASAAVTSASAQTESVSEKEHGISMSHAVVQYSSIKVDGLNIAYREDGDPSNPKLVLLHGFPSSSHQYRNLLPALADEFHVIAPDYPGFGNSDMPDPATYSYTFDKFSEVIESFLKIKGFDHYGLFVQDYGGPVGFRIVGRHPEALDWLIIQNTNAYEVGFTPAWAGLRNALWVNRTPEAEQGVAGLLALDSIKAVYLTGAKRPELSVPTIGIRISHSCSGPTRNAYSSICSTTTAPTLRSIRDGKPFCGTSSPKRLSSGARAIFFSLPRAEKRT